MRLAPVRCRMLQHSQFYLLLMPAARIVSQRPSSNFPYFRTPLANFLLSRPNSVEYGNSKTTILSKAVRVFIRRSNQKKVTMRRKKVTMQHSAKCTPPLFQGRTGCGMPASSLLLVASDLLLRTIKFCAVSFGVMLRLIVTSSSAVAERPCFVSVSS